MKRIWISLKNFLSKFLMKQEYVATKCGHKTKLKGCLEVFEEKIGVTLELKDGEVGYCQDCLSEMAIQCAWCMGLIMPGDPITLYTPNENFKVPSHAVVYSKDPLQLVGCLRMDCAESGADRAGFWAAPGKVFRVSSSLGQAMATGNMVIVGDLSDINEAVEQTKKTFEATRKKQ